MSYSIDLKNNSLQIPILRVSKHAVNQEDTKIQKIAQKKCFRLLLDGGVKAKATRSLIISGIATAILFTAVSNPIGWMIAAIAVSAFAIAFFAQLPFCRTRQKESFTPELSDSLRVNIAESFENFLTPEELIRQSAECMAKPLNQQEANVILSRAQRAVVNKETNVKISRKEERSISRSILVVEDRCYLLTSVKKKDKKIGSGGFKLVKYAIPLNPKREQDKQLLVLGTIKKSNLAERNMPKHMVANEFRMMTLAKDIPQVVQCKDFLEHEKRFYVLMEYCDDGDLYTQLFCEPSIELNLKSELCLAIDYMEGVVALHKKGIYHRDLKPDNLFIKEGRGKIGDLGSAVQIEDKYILRGAGTFGYLSPDYILAHIGNDDLAKVEATKKLDAWSMGLVLSSLFDPQHQPFLRGDFFEFLHTKEDLPRLQHEIDRSIHNLRKIPPQIVTIIRGLLSVEPQNRWSVEQALEQLTAIQRDQAV